MHYIIAKRGTAIACRQAVGPSVRLDRSHRLEILETNFTAS